MEKFDLVRAIEGQNILIDGKEYELLSASKSKKGSHAIASIRRLEDGFECEGAIYWLQDNAHMKPKPQARWVGVWLDDDGDPDCTLHAYHSKELVLSEYPEATPVHIDTI